MNWGWGNLVTSLTVSRVVGSKLFMNTTAAFTRYRSDLKMGYEDQYVDKSVTPHKTSKSEIALKYDSGIHDWRLRLTLIIRPARRTISSSAQTTRITRFHPMCRR